MSEIKIYFQDLFIYQKLDNIVNRFHSRTSPLDSKWTDERPQTFDS